MSVLPIEIREMILKHLIEIKVCEKVNMGWAKVHDAIKMRKKPEDFMLVFAEKAAEEGDEKKLILCKECGLEDFNLPILIAAKHTKVNIVRLYKEFGATNLDDILYDAAEYGNERIIRLCKELGATDFNPPMSIAAMQGFEKIVNICIEFGARSFNEAIDSAEWVRNYSMVSYLMRIRLEFTV